MTNISSSHSVLQILYFDDCYINKFDFKNYLFDNLGPELQCLLKVKEDLS